MPCQPYSIRNNRPLEKSFGAYLVLALAAVAASVSGEDRTNLLAANTGPAPRSSSLVPLHIDTGPDQLVTIDVVLDGQERTLLLRPFVLRSAQFRVLVQSTLSGELISVEPPDARTYRGTVAGLPGAFVSATIVNGTVTATIRDGATIWGVQPANRLGLSAARDEHLVYRSTDWTDAADHTCSTPQRSNVNSEDQIGEAQGLPFTTGVVSAQIAIDTDVEYFELNGKSIEATIIDVETILNSVAFIFERDVMIGYEITTIVVRTVEPDPYDTTNTDALFCAFRTQWNTGPESAIPRDVAHLFTGKTLDAKKIGLSRFATICNKSVIDPFGCPGDNANLAYGISQSHFSPAFTSRVALVAHELGHNWNAVHCDGQDECHIMCSAFGLCDGIQGSNLKFDATAINAMKAFRDSRSCLAEVLTPQPLPFFDPFPAGTLDASKWSYNFGAVVTTDAVAEPSGSASLNLDATDDGDFSDDQVRSHTIALDRAQAARCSYATQHRGVEAGESLLVEYWNSDLTWKLLNRIESDGEDQSTFVPHSHVLPDDARHAKFRLRFRAEVSDPDNDWYIDDVSIVETCSNNEICQDDLFCNGQELCVEGVCVSGPDACGDEIECEEALLACHDAACLAPTLVDATNRYLSVSVPDGLGPVALIVAPECDSASAKYVGRPSPDGFALLEADDEPAARLTPSQWGSVVHIAGANIVPQTGYSVWAECVTDKVRTVSAPVEITTTLWGDITGGFENNNWKSPDDAINVGDDILALIQSFQRVPGAPAVHRSDLLGVPPSCVPDLSIDIRDVLQSISGFQGLSYPQATSCPTPCP